MLSIMASLAAALQFLTIVPIARAFDEVTIARSMLCFPIVGLMIGAVLVAVAQLPASIMVVAALVLVVWVLLTGGLHLDGLADSADAWAAGRDNVQRALAVMKDPRCGPFAVVVVVLLLLCKFAGIVELLDTQLHWGLLLIPVLGRCAILVLYATTSYIRQQGLGEVYQQYIGRQQLGWVLAVCALAALLALGVVPLLISLATLMLLRRLMLKHLGGMTGDTLGASVEITECSVLVALVLWA